MFKRAPFLAEWTRFQQKYASKVRHLVAPTTEPGISSITLQLFQLCSHCSPLLPNLTSIDWNGNETNLPFITLFISRSLTSISIDVSAKAGRMLPPILMRLSKMSPNISKILVQRLKYEPSLEEASSHLIMQCNPHRLRKFDVDAPLSASAFRRIMQLPSLEEFWVVGSCHLPDPLPAVVFPSLQVLDVDFNGDLTWLKLLPAIQSPVLSAISVDCPGNAITRFMESFQLTITGCGMHERFHEFRVRNRDDFNITPQIIACNFSFTRLTSLTFLSNCTVRCQTSDLTDDDIDLLTNAMPGLKSLSVGEQPCSVPSKITFKSLYTLSRRCTGLTTLQIHFNPNSFITKISGDLDSGDSLGLVAPSCDLCAVTKVDVGKIALPTQSMSFIMALGLLGVFPRLEELEYENVAWKEIDDLIRVQKHIHAFVMG